MKLMRVGAPGAERPALQHTDGTIRDLSSIIDDVGGDALLPANLDRLRNLDPSELPTLSGQDRGGPCVGRVGKFICIGLNYADHAAESGMEVPSEPVVFMKATSAISGPFDDVELPQDSEKSDWEVELGVVIGSPAKNVTLERAIDHVAGYCVINDLSERAFQLEHGGQWVKGKSADTFGPIGPWLVTRDEIPEPGNLGMWLEVNGTRMQDGSTRTMIFDVPFLISYLSRFMSLQTGDIISTGTPPCVGMGQTPAQYLRVGDKIKLGIEGLGEQQQRVRSA